MALERRMDMDDDSERRAELRRQQMRIEPRQEPRVEGSGSTMEESMMEEPMVEEPIMEDSMTEGPLMREEPMLEHPVHMKSDEEIEMLDTEERIDSNRTVSRFTIMIGVFCMLFAGFWLIYAGWDIRQGSRFSIGMIGFFGILGLVLVVAGFLKRSRQPMVRSSHRRDSEINRAA